VSKRLEPHNLPALALLLTLAACGGKTDRRPPPPEAGYVVMAPQAVPLQIELAGRTTAFETSDVRPQVTGVIKARRFTEGGLVKRGQTLYEIDPSLYRATVSQAQANLANAEAARVAAEAKAQRYKPLADIEAVSKQDYADAEAAAKQAAAQVAQTRAALETARINLRFTTVPAPISGRIGRSLATTGALVTSGQAGALATIERLDPIFVDIQQSSAEIVGLRRELASGGVTPSGAGAQLTLEDGGLYPYPGRIEFAEAIVDENTGTVTLRARFPNPQGLLLPGMFVRARLSQVTAPKGGLARSAGERHRLSGGPGRAGPAARHHRQHHGGRQMARHRGPGARRQGDHRGPAAGQAGPTGAARPRRLAAAPGRGGTGFARSGRARGEGGVSPVGARGR
jgi:membrane fusion protein (multidrug efflux system)